MIARVLAALALATLLPTEARAAAEGGGVSALIWHAINLLLLVAILIRYGRAPVKSFFAERRRGIESELDAARRQLDEAEEKLSQWRARLAELDSEVAQLRERVQTQAEAEAERILAQARAAAERIGRDAKAAVELEARRAREQLRRDAGALAVQVAGTLLQEHIGERDRSRLVDEFVTHVAQASNGGGASRSNRER